MVFFSHLVWIFRSHGLRRVRTERNEVCIPNCYQLPWRFLADARERSWSKKFGILPDLVEYNPCKARAPNKSMKKSCHRLARFMRPPLRLIWLFHLGCAKYLRQRKTPAGLPV